MFDGTGLRTAGLRHKSCPNARSAGERFLGLSQFQGTGTSGPNSGDSCALP